MTHTFRFVGVLLVGPSFAACAHAPPPSSSGRPATASPTRPTDSDGGNAPALDAAPATDNAPSIQHGPPRFAGRLRLTSIQSVMHEREQAFAGCYLAALRIDPSARGRVVVAFRVDAQGKVVGADAESSDLPDADLRACIARVTRTLSFPEPETGSGIVFYPLIFSPR